MYRFGQNQRLLVLPAGAVESDESLTQTIEREIMFQRHENPTCSVEQKAQFADALTFMAADRGHVEEACSGDIIGIHNHGTIRIGDTLITLFSAQSLYCSLR